MDKKVLGGFAQGGCWGGDTTQLPVLRMERLATLRRSLVYIGTSDMSPERQTCVRNDPYDMSPVRTLRA